MPEAPFVSASLDPAFRPAVLEYNAYLRSQRRRPGVPLVLAVEREQGLLSRFEMTVAAEDPPTPETYRLVERMAKFLLWSRGGWRLLVGGPPGLGRMLSAAYAPGGERAFDAGLWSRVYERAFEVSTMTPEEVPPERENPSMLGGHLNGCRLGFDLGASDYKLAAVRAGDVVFSTEIPWDPRNEADPEVHYRALQAGLQQAAAHLPRVDAIGGSSAGVLVANRPMIASLFRAVPEGLYREKVLPLFERLQRAWDVPLVVINDGEVTALAGSMALKATAVLGFAMGSSEAAGYLDPAGRLRGWQNELAFAPVDFSAQAARDEWSGDAGVGALYFSQQAVARLAPAAGFDFGAEIPLPERLEQVQQRMADGDPGAQALYETLGIYLGYTLPWYRLFYDFRHVLLLGRVTSGDGGQHILKKAQAVLEECFPEEAREFRLHMPDERMKRVGQSVAAASLPEIPTA